MQGLINNGKKKENDSYTYAMFNKLMPLARSPSSMHTKVASNILREFGIPKKRGENIT